MSKALPFIAGGCLISVACFLCLVLWDAHKALQSFASVPQSLQTAVKGIPDAVAKVGTAADNLGGVIADERKAETKRDVEFYRFIAAGKETMVRVDLALTGHDGVLPAAQRAITVLSTDSHVTLQQIEDAAIAGHMTLNAGTAAINSLNQRISDPQIPELIGHLNTASLHFAQTSEHVDQTSADLQQVADHYRAEIMKPVGFWKSAGKLALHMVTIPLR